MASEKPGYFLFLSLIIARCVRGQYGAPFVIKHTVTNWITFTRDFGAFCKGLVVAAESYSKEMGRTHLAHRDGLAAAFSGLQFLRTLKRKACRMRLSALANEFKSLFTRLLRHKGRTCLTDEEFTSLGDAMMGLNLNHARTKVNSHPTRIQVHSHHTHTQMVISVVC